MPKIMVAIANYKGFLAADTSKSLESLFLHNYQSDFKINWMRSVSTGCPVLPRVRNHLVQTMLNEGCDGILFVDDDIGFEAAEVYKMIQRGFGLIGAVPQRRNHVWNAEPSLAVPPAGMRFAKTEEGYDIAFPPEPKLPMACTFIAAQVFRDILEEDQRRAKAGEPLLCPPYIYTPSSGQRDVCHQFFGYELVPAPEWSLEYKTGREMGIEVPMCEDGEDHYFCRRAAMVGYESLIDVNVELRHWEGQVCHDYSFKKYLAENASNLKVEEQAEAA